MPAFIYIGNSNIIELQALTNAATDVVDTGATVTVTLKDSAGVNVVGQTWPATMTHDADGLYRAILEDDLAITVNGHYTAHIEAVGTASEVGHWEVAVKARTRTL